MTYEITATFPAVTMRKPPGEVIEVTAISIVYTLQAEALNELGLVVNQDWVMDLHSDTATILKTAMFLAQNDPDLDDVSALAAGYANIYVLGDVGYAGIADFLYGEIATRITDGCLPNKVWVHMVAVNGYRRLGA